MAGKVTREASRMSFNSLKKKKKNDDLPVMKYIKIKEKETYGLNSLPFSNHRSLVLDKMMT